MKSAATLLARCERDLTALAALAVRIEQGAADGAPLAVLAALFVEYDQRATGMRQRARIVKERIESNVH